VGSTQTLLTLGTYQDFLNVYRKPMMSSLADLQAIINMQVGGERCSLESPGLDIWKYFNSPLAMSMVFNLVTQKKA